MSGIVKYRYITEASHRMATGVSPTYRCALCKGLMTMQEAVEIKFDVLIHKRHQKGK